MSGKHRAAGASGAVGIIANPAAGKDVRRLVALASTFDNQEKVRIVRRALAGLAATGVRCVYYLPDSFGIVTRAAENNRFNLDLEPIPVPCTFTASDSEQAARWLAEHGAACILTLGGDGTNRVVARGCREVPLVPIATGTNNVFPYLVDGTIAGLAAGLLAVGQLDDSCLEQRPRLEVWIDGTLVDIALIDVAVSRERFLGTRAIWDPNTIDQIIVSRVIPGVIGLAAVAAALSPNPAPTGAFVELGQGSMCVTVPLAPGLVTRVPIRAWSPLELGAEIILGQRPCTLALDGERELRIERSHHVVVRLSGSGPLVLDPRLALREAARRGCFLSPFTSAV